ncbi:MAG: autotransporter-associated beta strand repeat-containing protein, partial [Verrucomicrobiales bacterium]|jgi:fibronectin-binding autotransporter adhesin|nr:autotransporter-associated beta strand repeat-containing protein [Verrucomicrobiales bacterium]
VLKQIDNINVNANLIGQSNNAARLWLRQGLVDYAGGVVIMAGNNINEANTGTLLVEGGTLNILNNSLTLGYINGNVAAGGKAVATLSGGLTQVKGVAFGGSNSTGSFVASTTATLIVNGGTLAIGSGGITKASVAMAGNNVILGGGVVKALEDFSVDAALPLTLFASGTFDTNGKVITVSGDLAGSGTFTKAGAGTLLLDAANNTYAGDAVVNAGTLQVSGTLTLDTLTFNLDGANSGLVGGGGSLSITNLVINTGAATGSGDWTLFDLTGLTLNEFTVSGWNNTSGKVWELGDYSFDAMTGVLSVIPEPSTWALLVIGGALLAATRRRR